MPHRLTVCLLTAALLGAPAASATPPLVQIVPLAGPLHLVTGPGGNVALLADPDGGLLIDAQFARTAEALQAALAPLPGGDRIRVLINTHWHADHTDGNTAFGPGATIIAHVNTWRHLSTDRSLRGRTVAALPPPARPNVTFTDRLILHAAGVEARLIHVPRAHTDGDVLVHFPSLGVIHMGDLYFNGLFPFLDVAHGGDIDNWADGLAEILSWLPPDTRVIPGHGPLSGVDGLRAFHDLLRDSAAHVRGRLAAGLTLEQIQAEGLPDRFEPWSHGFLSPADWVGLVHDSLLANPR